MFLAVEISPATYLRFRRFPGNVHIIHFNPGRATFGAWSVFLSLSQTTTWISGRLVFTTLATFSSAICTIFSSHIVRSKTLPLHLKFNCFYNICRFQLCSAVTWLGGRTVISSLPKTDSLVDFIEDGKLTDEGLASITLSSRQVIRIGKLISQIYKELYSS